MLKRNTTIFIAAVIVWEVVVAVLYGVFFRYSTSTTFKSMTGHSNFHPWALSTTVTSNVQAETTQQPYPYFIIMVAIILMITGTFGVI